MRTGPRDSPAVARRLTRLIAVSGPGVNADVDYSHKPDISGVAHKLKDVLVSLAKSQSKPVLLPTSD